MDICFYQWLLRSVKSGEGHEWRLMQSKAQVRMNRMLQLPYQVLCYLLLLSLVIYISIIYFKYATDTNVAPYTPIRQTLPTVSLCFDLSTLLFGNVSGYFFEPTYPIYASLTTGLLFKKSPSVSQLLKRCSYRLFDTDTFWANNNSTECTILFNIKRYRMQGYMCYKLKFVETGDYSFYLNTHSISYQRKLFFFVLDEPFNQGHIILPLIHFDEFPYYERLFDQEIVPPLTHGEAYILSYRLYEIIKLPPPYITQCTNKVAKGECINVCRDAGYAKLNYTSHYSIVPEEQTEKNLKVAFFTNTDPVFEEFVMVRRKCREKCIFDPCEQRLAITYVAPPSRTSGINLMVETAQFPVTKVLHKAKLRFADYILQCLSWAGICIGFSILNSFFKLHPRAKKKQVPDLIRHSLIFELDFIKLANSLHAKGFFSRNKVQSNYEDKLVKKKKYKSRLVFFLASYTLMTFIFLLWQLYNVTSHYFLFETAWKFAHHMDRKLVLPNTVICISLDRYFKVALTKKYILDATNYHRIFTERDDHLNFTIEELLNQSWNESILSKCRVWNWSRGTLFLKTYSREECFQHFVMQKVISTSSICYIFKPQQPPPYLSIWKMKLNPFRSGVMYSLIPTERLDKNFYTELIVYFGDDQPYLSEQHSVLADRMLKKRIQVLSFSLFEVKLLPPPYDTNCIAFARNNCKYNCYMESVNRINRVSHGETYSTPLKHLMVSYSCLTNHSINEYWVQLENKCYHKCLRDTCQFNYTSTTINYAMDRSEFKTEFAVTSSPNPVTEQVAIPRMTFYDFCYQIFCCFSFWMGFSLASLNLTVRNRVASTLTLGECLAERKIQRLLFRLNSLSTFASGPSALKREYIWGVLKRKVRKKLPCSLCILGCLIHLSTSLDYFRFPIILDTMRELDTETTHVLTICIDGFHFFKKHARPEKHWMKPFDFHMWQSSLLNLTVEEMFRQTPDENHLIVLCRVWGLFGNNKTVNDLSQASDRLFLMERNGSKCHKYFRVRKFFMQTKICYSFTPTVKLKWNRHQVSNIFSHRFFKTFYSISFNSSFITQKFSVIITSQNAFHGHSSIFSPAVIEDYTVSKWHVVSYTKYIQKVLPPPYSDGGFTHTLHMKCIDLCINGQLEPLNKSLTSIFYYPSKRKFVTFADRVQNRTFNTWLNQRLESCERGCKYPKIINLEPTMEFTVTDISDGRRSVKAFSRGGQILTSFYLRGTTEPVSVIVFRARISLFEFLITIGSIISIWFGLSAKNIPQSVLARRMASTGELVSELRFKLNLLAKLTEKHSSLESEK